MGKLDKALSQRWNLKKEMAQVVRLIHRASQIHNIAAYSTLCYYLWRGIGEVLVPVRFFFHRAYEVINNCFCCNVRGAGARIMAFHTVSISAPDDRRSSVFIWIMRSRAFLKFYIHARISRLLVRCSSRFPAAHLLAFRLKWYGVQLFVC